MEYSKNLQKLLKLGSDTLNGRNKLDYKKYNLSEDDIPELSKMAFDEALFNSKIQGQWSATYHALNALIQFKSMKDFSKLISILPDNRDNDYLNEIAIDSIRILEDASFEDVEDALLNKDYTSDAKMTLLNGLSDIAKKRQDFNKRIVEMVTKTVDKQGLCSASNGFAVMVLVDAGGLENIEKIREIFQTKDVDDFIVGDLEDIEINLGIMENRDTPKKTRIF
ncbi:MAG: hypothetical protein Q9M43_14135 [Sulfurimonas sp.]|nr:hypothetical protein [Sulfurimonas sp.]